MSALARRFFPLCLCLLLALTFPRTILAANSGTGQMPDPARQDSGPEAPASDHGRQIAEKQAEILLDPGHSKLRQGATSCTGLGEFAYNNGLVHFLYGHLARAGIRVDVTRDPEGEASLTQRALMARGRKLLLSIHHDSAQPQFIKMVNGRPFSDKARGYSIFVSGKNPFFKQSLAAARILGQALYDLGLRPSTHHGEPIAGENRPILDPMLGIYQYDNLIVLKQAQAPAVLLEAGVIIAPDDEVLVRTTDFRARVTKAVEQTIRQALDGFPGLQ